MKVYLRAAELIADKRDNLWLPMSELPNDTELLGTDDIIQIGNQYFEILAYSESRDAFWVQEIQVEGAAEMLDQEFAEYVKGLGSN